MANTVEFTVQNAWRRDGVTDGEFQCVDTTNATLPQVPCSGADGNPSVGDVFVEFQGGTKFDFGDGSTKVGSPRGPLTYLVTSEDPVNNWVFALALDPSSLPAPSRAPADQDTTIQHTYSHSGARTAKVSDCCRISPCVAPNAHMNNPDDDYVVSTTVDVGSGNSSPVSSLAPIKLCPQNGLCTFQVPVSDNELDTVHFRMATPSEAGFTSQPGSPQCPNAASIDPVTGVYSWNTTGCRLAGDPGPQPPNGGCNNSALNTLYSTQVMIEEPAKGTKVALDFLIQLVPQCTLSNAPPFFEHPPTPVCGSTLSVNPNHTVSFSVQASDPDVSDTVTLTAAGVPQSATLTPSLPSSGRPVSTAFSWTPSASDLGSQFVINFSATDGCQEQTDCSVIIDVSQEDCTDGVDNDGDGLADCADPDCNGTPCDDGDACTTGDTCSNGACNGGGPLACDACQVCDSGLGCTGAACTVTPVRYGDSDGYRHAHGHGDEYADSARHRHVDRGRYADCNSDGHARSANRRHANAHALHGRHDFGAQQGPASLLR